MVVQGEAGALLSTCCHAVLECESGLSVCCSHPCRGSLQGGKPSKRQLAAARESPEHKAMPTRFFCNVLILVHWQSQLVSALDKLK